MKQMLKRIYWTAIGLTMLVAIAVIAMLVNMRIDTTRETLRSILQTASVWTEESTQNLHGLANNIASSSPPLRVTFILDHGYVIADSAASSLYMDNHMHRPEIVMALEGNIGEDLRVSDTEDVLTMYAAIHIEPNLILRLSYPLDEILNLLYIYAVSVILLFVLLYVIQRLMLNRMSRRIHAQMDAVIHLLDGTPDGDTERLVFDELRPHMRRIGYKIERLSADYKEIQDTLNLRQHFIANASHELKSPLTSIRGFADMLREGMADSPEEQYAFLDLILNECDRMREVIEDVLMLSRAEIASDQPRALVNVEAVAREIAASLTAKAMAAQIRIEVEGELKLSAVEKEIWEIMYNLMDNAVSYGRAGGFVRVTLSQNEICVEDDGIGIAKEHIPLLFEEFYRVDSSSSRGAGTGLGLSIVKRLAEKYSAQLSVESAPGAGTKFTVRFVSAV